MIKNIIMGLLLTASTLVAADKLAWIWDIPAEREDGSSLPIEEISGYVISYGKTGEVPEEVFIEGAMTTETVIDVEAGTYVASIATVDSDGEQGNFSPAQAFTAQELKKPKPAAPANTFRFEFLCEPEPCNLEIK